MNGSFLAFDDNIIELRILEDSNKVFNCRGEMPREAFLIGFHVGIVLMREYLTFDN